jgi:hypothetical protein
VQAIICLNLVKEIGQGGGRICSNGSDEVVIRGAKAIKNVPYEFIIIQWFSCSGKFRSESFHLGKVLLSREVILLGIIECAAELLHSRLGGSRNMGVEGGPDFGRCV